MAVSTDPVLISFISNLYPLVSESAIPLLPTQRDECRKTIGCNVKSPGALLPGFQFRKMKVLEVGGGEGHQQYVKMVEMANFMLWIFYHDKKELG